MSAPPSYDFIVVGTGAGGGQMIARLVLAGFRVLGIEAGGSLPPATRRGEMTQITGDEELKYDWPYRAESELTGYGFFTPDIDQSMGKMVGGAGNHYGYIDYRGSNEDFDEWDWWLIDGASVTNPSTIGWLSAPATWAGTLGGAADVTVPAADYPNLNIGDFIQADTLGAGQPPFVEPPYKIVGKPGANILTLAAVAAFDGAPGHSGPLAPTAGVFGTIKNSIWNKARMFEHFVNIEFDIDAALFGTVDATLHGTVNATPKVPLGRVGTTAAALPAPASQNADFRPLVNPALPRIPAGQVAAMQNLTLSVLSGAAFTWMPDRNNSQPLLGPLLRNVHKYPRNEMGAEDGTGNLVAGGTQVGSAFHLNKYDERKSQLIVAIDPIRNNPLFTLEADCVTDKVTMLRGSDGRLKVTGVEYYQSNPDGTVTKKVAASSNVVLAAAAYSTPAILMRSGIGPVDRLAPIGVVPLVELEAVGADALQHTLTGRLSVPMLAEWNQVFQGGYFGGMFRSSQVRVLADIGVGTPSVAFDTEPDVNFFFGGGVGNENGPVGGAVSANPVGDKQAQKNYGRNFAATISFFKARSRGDGIRPVTSSPFDVPIIRDGRMLNPNMKEAEATKDAYDAVKAKLEDVAPGLPFVTYRSGPAPASPSIQQVVETCGGAFHIVSTVKMGPPTQINTGSFTPSMGWGSACDQYGRVYEGSKGTPIRGLACADTSIFPTHVRANPYLTTVASSDNLASEFILNGGINF